MIVRRERPHPGAQLSFTDHDGYRFQAILTDQADPDIAVLECRHRQHAHVEDRIRYDKDTGLSKFPFKEFALNEVWLEIVMLAHNLMYDGAHGVNDMHRYNRGGENAPAETFHAGTLREGMRAAIAAVRTGYKEVIDAWRAT